MSNNNLCVALITGAARRIGSVISEQLHKQGYRVIIHYRNSQAEAQALCAHLNSIRKDSAMLVAADLLRTEEIEPTIQQVQQRWGRLDVLINNASTFYPTPIGAISEQQWLEIIDSNLKAPLFLAQAAKPYLQASGNGCIINITDIRAKHPLKNYCVYSIAKAGLNMLTLSLAKELAPIRVNAIAPGTTLWPEGSNTLSLSQKNEIVEKTVLKRIPSPIDIANAAIFLIQQRSITGQILSIDGGRFL